MNNPNFDKDDYKLLKDIAKETDTRIIQQNPEYEFVDGITGVTVAYRLMTKNRDCKMLAVAVSYCSSADKFKKKVGKYQALFKLEEGHFVQLPLAYLVHVGEYKKLEDKLLEMFVDGVMD